jgi:hypothetical protein
MNIPNRFRHEQPAPEADCEALLSTIALHWPSFFPPDVLDELRQLLRQYSPAVWAGRCRMPVTN